MGSFVEWDVFGFEFFCLFVFCCFLVDLVFDCLNKLLCREIDFRGVGLW